MPTVLITGSNRGLGIEFARQYAADGWRVLATCRNPGAAGQLQRLAQANEAMLSIVAMDVTDDDSIQNAATHLKDVAITGRIDYSSWAKVLDVNTMGPLRVLEAFIDSVARSERRLVVTITSGLGSLADNTSGGSIAYRSSKAAVNMVMRSAAVDLAPRRITCVLVNPGWVRTDLGGPGATLTPRESVSSLRRMIEKLGPNDSGKFYHRDGREYAW